MYFSFDVKVILRTMQCSAYFFIDIENKKYLLFSKYARMPYYECLR